MKAFICSIAFFILGLAIGRSSDSENRELRELLRMSQENVKLSRSNTALARSNTTLAIEERNKWRAMVYESLFDTEGANQ